MGLLEQRVGCKGKQIRLELPPGVQPRGKQQKSWAMKEIKICFWEGARAEGEASRRGKGVVCH